MSSLKDLWDSLTRTTPPPYRYDYYSGGGSSSNNDSLILYIVIIAAIIIAGILVLSCLVCMIRGCCNLARKQNCPLLCRICRRSCRSQCGTAYVSPEEAILRPYEGVLENDELFMKSVTDNQILKSVVCEINRSCLHLNLEPQIVGSLKERLGKPTRVITEEYPTGLPSRSPLCTDIDVMMICKSLSTTHNPLVFDRLIIIPSSSSLGFAKLQIPYAVYTHSTMGFVQSLSARVDHFAGNTRQTSHYLSAELVKQTLLGSLRNLHVKRLMKKTKAKLHHHSRALKVEQRGPAVKVVIRQQMSSCTRCCMLGQCSLRLCCCMTACLRDDDLDVSFEGDFTFALRVGEWPSLATEWIQRPRIWPHPNVIQCVLSRGCALVPKSDWGEELLWRYSFSEAEYTLINNVPPPTLKVVLSIKGLLKRYNCPLKSYALKSMMLWCLEAHREDPEILTDSQNLPRIFDCLLKEFLNMIREGRCRHYFMREINLLQEDNIQRIVEILEEILADPYSYLTTRALEKSRCCALSTMICRLMCGCHDTESTLDIY